MLSVWLGAALVLVTPSTAPVPTIVVPLGRHPAISPADVATILGPNDAGGGSFASQSCYYSKLHLTVSWCGGPDRPGLRLANVHWSCSAFGIRLDWD